MQKSLLLYSSRRWWLAIGCFLGASLLLGSTTRARATDIYTASYGGTNDTGGGAPLASGTFSLGTFTITGIYGSGASETLFVTDGTANTRIYGTAPAGAAVGQQYTATVTASVYQGTEEFKSATNFTLQTGTATVTPQSATLAQVAATVNGGTANPFTSSPADSLYATEGRLLFAPVTFTITPNASGALSTTTSTTLTDQATGDTVILYKSTTAAAYTAGQVYTVTGYEQPYNGSGTQESEIVGTTSFTASFAAPNPIYRQTTSGSWAPSGGTDWATTAAGPGSTGWINDGTYTAFFQKAPTGAITINAGNIKATGLEFDANGYTIASDGLAGDTLTLQNAGLVTVTNATDTATISAPIAGSVGLTKSGAGTLILGGVNTYTGTTTIIAGTLQVSADTALGASGNALALAGGTLQSGLTTGTLTLARNISGTGGLGIAANSSLAVSGAVTAGTLTLPGGGSLVLTNTGNLGDNASNSFAGLVFQTAGASVQAQSVGNGSSPGVIDLGASGITATHASGAVGITANFQAASGVTTLPINVATAGSTLTLSGVINAAAVLAKTGAGTLVLNTDNSLLSGSGSTMSSIRQGTVGTTPGAGGIISIPAGNPNPTAALGTGEFDANGGTLSNDTRTPLVFANAISAGAQISTANPNGLLFAGNGAMTFTGSVSLYKASSTTTSYQHAMTVNTPTTFSGLFTVSTGTGNSSGLTIAGNSTLTLSGTSGANTFIEPVTIATSGTGSGVILAKNGAFGANTGITLNAGATLTINTGVMTGTVNAINDAALLSFNTLSGAFGKIVLGIGTATETVGGLYLAAGDGTLTAGYQPAGTYGPTGSGAQHIDANLFSGSGLIMNLGTTVPEPSTWAAVLVGMCGLATAVARRGRGRRV